MLNPDIGVPIMETVRDEAETKPQTEQHLPWHKPEIERLKVTLDTGNSILSGGDAETHGLFTG